MVTYGVQQNKTSSFPFVESKILINGKFRNSICNRKGRRKHHIPRQVVKHGSAEEPIQAALYGRYWIPFKRHKQVIASPELERLKMDLYRNNYWRPVWGDRINLQSVANDMYDASVNMGPGTSIIISERQFKLKETGRMSDELLNKLNSVR